MSKLIDITKSIGLPLTVVLTLLVASYKLSSVIETDRADTKAKFASIDVKLDDIKREITSNNDRYEKEFTALRDYIDSKFEIENLKAENYNLRLKILNPEIRLPE